MGRKLRITIPTITEQLLPKKKEIKVREQQQKNFNTHHRASPLKSLNSGDLVYIPDNVREGTVVEESSPQSNIVQIPEGTWCHYQMLPIPRILIMFQILQTGYQGFYEPEVYVSPSLQIN